MRIEERFPEISKAKSALLNHPLYREVNSIQRLQWFMEDHVFAVWDFMSLTKRLQRELSCISLPWMPVADVSLVRFINDVVMSEESDIDMDGTPRSHLEMYLKAMEEVKADVCLFKEFLASLRSEKSLVDILHGLPVAEHVRVFVCKTIDRAINGDPVEVVADFLFGREDVIPDMFAQLLRFWDGPGSQVPTFKYYLERHIALDGDEHGPAARQMLETIAGDDPVNWDRAAAAALDAINSRIALWDGIRNKIWRMESPNSRNSKDTRPFSQTEMY